MQEMTVRHTCSWGSAELHAGSKEKKMYCQIYATQCVHLLAVCGSAMTSSFDTEDLN